MNNLPKITDARGSMLRVFSLIVVLLLMSAQSGIAQSNAPYSRAENQRIYQILKNNNSKEVQALPQNNREIFMAMLSLKSGRLNDAIEDLHNPTLDHDPLVALIKAEIYRQQAIRAASHAGDYAISLKGSIKRLETVNLGDGLVEAERRLQAFTEKLDGRYSGAPFDLLAMGSDVVNVFIVDKARSRMFIFRNDGQGHLKKISDEYVVTGAKAGDKRREGDKRTPSGVYRFVDKLTGRRLPKGYGPVAFPIDYPNTLDRLHHFTGDGIWMHGYEDGVDRRPPQDTKGCFVLPNQRLLTIAGNVQLGHSWVVIGENIVFGDDSGRKALLESVETAVDAWKRDWESLDTKAYLAHYDSAFRSGKYNLKSWTRYKRRVNRHKHYISLSLSDFTIIHNPARVKEGEVVLVEFNQQYRSSNYSGTSRKRLYLLRKNNRDTWRILIEREVKTLPMQSKSALLMAKGGNGSISVQTASGRNRDSQDSGGALSASWIINLAAFRAKDKAVKLMDKIHASVSDYNLSVSAVTIKGRQWYRLHLGYFDSRLEAEKMVGKIGRKYGLSKVWIDQVRGNKIVSNNVNAYAP